MFSPTGYTSYKEYVDYGLTGPYIYYMPFDLPSRFIDLIPDCSNIQDGRSYRHISIYASPKQYSKNQFYLAVDDISKLYLILPTRCHFRWQCSQGIFVSHIPMFITGSRKLGHDPATDKTWYLPSTLARRIPDTNVMFCHKPNSLRSYDGKTFYDSITGEFVYSK